MNNTNEIRKEYLSSSSIEYKDDFNGEVYSVSDRFMTYGMYLKVGETLGFEIVMNSGEPYKNYIYLDSDNEVSTDEFDWIFNNYAKVIPDKYILEDKATKNYRVKYTAVVDKSININFIDDDIIYMIPNSGYFKAMCKEISEVGGHISVIIVGGKKDGNIGSIIFDFPQRISKKLKALITMVFKGCVLEEVGDEVIDNNISKKNLKDYIIILLKILGMQQKVDKDSIDNLELGVRSYNALKKANVTSIKRLLEMSDMELLKIRNLGRKCISEIRTQLIEKNYMSSCEDRFFENMDSTLLTEIPKDIFEDMADKRNYMDELQALVGIKNAKDQVKRILAFAKMRKAMEENGEHLEPITMNMEFVGNPGTAKTTVARIVAGLLKEISIITTGNFIEVGRADLVAQYVGQTAPMVKNVFKRAKGGVLFIDEAYSLLEEVRGEFGDEAINTIVQEMENNRKDTIVIFAGYPDEMDEFFLRNPGLRSRVPFRVNFEDYNVEEMLDICKLEAFKKGFLTDDMADKKIMEICEKSIKNKNNGNGRLCRNLIEKGVLNFAFRNYGDLDVNEKIEYILRKEDFIDMNDLDLKSDENNSRIGFKISA
ncbi:DNA-directed RNA polymerase subunit alpha C-terminal domain-containing protein [Lachnoanaerobaculum gingivalis]|uniref:DNA-directed RNA polymerase subunit alpha C-terminal domain-containing protein n=1 Tax=Lachnoanaerobaculum gingivalis TaxID=2490855 RepID=UPI0024A7310A|nr:DNA-directed RNA polymerase subunit alpha C-terminal domain-containing protein [Lachnoanaerobaculum gingivalis]WHE88517.1 DNA-directed RNA polymerase subunit alpha C-terminal domain-containing protein [Lachnoanaerobaculum gingivalis]